MNYIELYNNKYIPMYTILYYHTKLLADNYIFDCTRIQLTINPQTSTNSPAMTISPPLRSSNLTSVPIDANRIGWSPNQIHSNTASTGLALLWAPSSTSSCDNTMVVGLLQFCFSSLQFQPVPATNDDMIQARGPAPGYPYH